VFEKAGMLYLYVETPLHAGSGTSLGIVDLPIQRERTTGYPMVQASGLKGCLREASKGKNKQKIKIVFGPDTKEAHEHAGALSVGDARILLFPVRSLLGVFAWVTSKDVLARFKRDAQPVGLEVDWAPVGPSADEEALTAGDALVSQGKQGKMVLEEFAFSAKHDETAQTIATWISENALPKGDEYEYWCQALPQRLVVLPENAFRDFTQFSTEIISRTRLDDTTKTVARGALWTEEHLPSDTLLYAPIFASKPRVADEKLPHDWKEAKDKPKAILEFVRECVDRKRIQLGGDSTVGRGFVAVRMSIPTAEGGE